MQVHFGKLIQVIGVDNQQVTEKALELQKGQIAILGWTPYNGLRKVAMGVATDEHAKKMAAFYGADILPEDTPDIFEKKIDKALMDKFKGDEKRAQKSLWHFVDGVFSAFKGSDEVETIDLNPDVQEEYPSSCHIGNSNK